MNSTRAMNYTPTVATTLAKLTEPGKLFAADEVQVLADALDALTARLTEADEALSELVEAFDEWNYGGTNAKMRRGRLRHEAALARARAALDAAEPGKDPGGDVPSPDGTDAETRPS